MTFVDANVFIRFLAPGDSVRGAACRAFFERVQSGQIQAITSEAVVAEIIYVLSSSRGAAYGVSRADITARLRPLLALQGLAVGDKPAVLHALDLYEAHSFLDFPDAVAAAHVMHRRLDSITSYDYDFDRIDGVMRVEPRDEAYQDAA